MRHVIGFKIVRYRGDGFPPAIRVFIVSPTGSRRFAGRRDHSDGICIRGGGAGKYRYIRTMRRLIKIGIAVLFVAGVAAGALVFMGFGGDAAGPEYRLAKVERGSIASTVSASGTLRAVVTVEVGSQISGLIKNLSADFNSEVKAGQVIARIDPANFEARVVQAEAEVTVSEANVSMQRATRAELEADMLGHRAGLSEAKEELKRKQALFRKRVVASSAVEKARASHEQARAKVVGAGAKLNKQTAQIEHALAQVKQKKAVLKQRRLDLSYTFIRSPVDGVVINRNVDVGQTVAASLQAPVLFTIAQDLTRMQVEVSVDEADIGRVREGQAVTFTVDSFPGRNFRGQVQQIRKAGKEVSNVITYTVVVSAENPGQRLLPGMTANVTVIVSQRDNALKVANAALRFRPPGAEALSGGQATARPRGRGNRRGRINRRIERIAKRLELNDEQKQGIRAIFRENGQKIRAMRQQGMERAEMAPAIARLRAASRPRIEALLTGEQRRKYRAMIAARGNNPTQRGRVWIEDGNGGAKAVAVVYGISDGSVSEIVRGDLKPGQQVIVGIARAAAKRRGRFRFGH